MPILNYSANKLHRDFVEHPDVSSGSFEKKFKVQLAQSDADTIQLAAEVLYVYMLPANGILPDTKRRQINIVFARAAIACKKSGFAISSAG